MKKLIKEKMVSQIKLGLRKNQDVSITRSIPPCEPKQNQQCMHNCMNEYKAGRAFAIIEVFSSVLHYLCIDEHGKIYDPTLGWEWTGCDYKLLSYVHPESGEFMGSRLNRVKKELIEKHCSAPVKMAAKALRLNVDELI